MVCVGLRLTPNPTYPAGDDAFQTVVEIDVTPKFYECISVQKNLINQCLQQNQESQENQEPATLSTASNIVEDAAKNIIVQFGDGAKQASGEIAKRVGYNGTHELSKKYIKDIYLKEVPGNKAK